jgi:hypothetical protein
MTDTITRQEAISKINEAKGSGKIFTVRFYKRTTGQFRIMNCRGRVIKGLTGGELKFDPESKGLITVFDMQNNGYRMINAETIQEVTINGVTFKVTS